MQGWVGSRNIKFTRENEAFVVRFAIYAGVVRERGEKKKVVSFNLFASWLPIVLC